MSGVGVIYTVPSLLPHIDSLLRQSLPGVPVTKVVAPDLLQRAMAGEDTRRDVVRHCRSLQDQGCESILVTCSSIGQGADLANQELDVPVIRIDAAMAREAAHLVGNSAGTKEVVVLATLPSTLTPSLDLVRRECPDVNVQGEVCEGAFDARRRGDTKLHDSLVVEAIRRHHHVSVIVLAQASMSDAALGAGVGVPVLSSLPGGVRAFAESVSPHPVKEGSR